MVCLYYMEESITLLSREESLATCQRKSSFQGFFSYLVPHRKIRRSQESLNQLLIIFKVNQALYRELSRLDSLMYLLNLSINQLIRHFMTFLMSKCE